MQATDSTRARRAVIAVALSAVATVVAVDLALQRVSPTVQLREVEDAVADYRSADPTVLVIGSSHGRTFHQMADLLAERTGGRERMLAVPVEWGKLSSYRWVLEHRLRPLIEQRRADGELVRPSLHHVIIVTEWWDSCAPDGPPFNLPARAWTIADFLADVARNGLTSYNRNYIYNRWVRQLRASVLVQDRGHDRIKQDLLRVLRGQPPHAPPPRPAERIAWWQAMVEQGIQCVASPSEMEALDGMLTYFGERGIETTLLLYPRMPATITPRAASTTLERFREAAAAVARAHGTRLVDHTMISPLTDDDFAADFDHVRFHGNQRYAAWALDRDLRLLLERTR